MKRQKLIYAIIFGVLVTGPITGVFFQGSFFIKQILEVYTVISMAVLFGYAGFCFWKIIKHGLKLGWRPFMIFTAWIVIFFLLYALASFTSSGKAQFAMFILSVGVMDYLLYTNIFARRVVEP